MSQEQDQIFALVAADRSSPAPPDLAALRTGGRRRLLHRRLAVGAAGLAVVAAIAVPLAVLGGDDGRAVDEVPPATRSATPSPTSSPTPSPTQVDPDSYRPEQGSVAIPGGKLQGEYEQGELVGDALEVDRLGDHEEIVYAARGPVIVPDGNVVNTYVAMGVRDGSRILRTVTALTPSAERPRDQISLYDGAIIDSFAGRDPYVRLVGSVQGDVEVTVTAPGGNPVPVTDASTSVLPGYTVFYYQAPWDESWDTTQLAPLTVTTDDGRSAQVRERSWSG